MSEKGPQIRMVGGASPEAKKLTRDGIQKSFLDNSSIPYGVFLEAFREGEFEKFPIEMEMIHRANKRTSALMSEAGIDPYDIPVENIHILKPGYFKKITDKPHRATTFRPKETIIINSMYLDNPVGFYAIVAHEMLHLKAHLSMEVEPKEGDHFNSTVFRSGVSVAPSQLKEERGEQEPYFDGLHEAIVAETEGILLGELLKSDSFKHEAEWLLTVEGMEARSKIAKDKNIAEKEILWIDPSDVKKFEVGSYVEQRSVLNYIYEEILKQFPDKFQSTQDVHKVFLNAHFTGKLLEIARLVEGTFGEGSFRVLGSMKPEGDSFAEVLSYLQTHRVSQ